MFFKMNKHEHFTPGFTCVLHTFGRDLKWNPHIHALISEGAAGNFLVWRSIKHFDYTFLRLAFRKVLLEQLSNHLDKSFKKLKNELYKKYPDSFYVRAQPLVLTTMMVSPSLFITQGTKTIKLLLNVFPLWISSNDLSFIYQKNILKCSVTTAFTQKVHGINSTHFFN